jgi:hypothetical protein
MKAMAKVRNRHPSWGLKRRKKYAYAMVSKKKKR